VGGAGRIAACQRLLLACSVLPAWGEPSRPGLAPEGETEKGEINFLAAAGFSSLVSNANVPSHDTGLDDVGEHLRSLIRW
jgi:hypothetical protein